MIFSAEELADVMPDASQIESNEPEMESSQHYAQLALMVACLEWLWQDKADFFIGANLTIYFSREQLKNRDFRGPDFFLVKNTEKRPRKSWVVWEEGGQYPDIIIELLSDSTARVDKTLKKELYQTRFRTPEYFWFSPETLEIEGYRLVNQVYERIQPDEIGYWSQVLDLYLGVSEGQLRYFTEEGDRIPTPTEAAQQAQAQAQQSTNRAEQLAEQLRRLGIEPEA
ncbi:MAG: Uma2 family endonuclease [Cyanobacteria bacterium J06554_11]